MASFVKLVPTEGFQVWPFEVLGEPLSKANINISPKLRKMPLSKITDPAARRRKERLIEAGRWEDSIARKLLFHYGRLELKGAVGVHIRYFLKSKSEPFKVRKDLDNLTKSLLDGLESGGAFEKGDEQVTCLFLEKLVDKERPRVEVSIWSAE